MKPNEVIVFWRQEPFSALSVFNFYPPNHRTQGKNILAPEQKMLTSDGFSGRMSLFSNALSNESLLNDAGCDVNIFKSTMAESDEKLLDLMSQRFFRGAIPKNTAENLIEANRNLNGREVGLKLVGSILDMASLTPAYGVSK
jgi:hypothetical protein